MVRSLAIVTMLCFLNLTFGADSYEGDPCQMTGSSERGTCKLLLNCLSAIEQLQQLRSPTHCGWSGDIEIVCCQNPPEMNRTDRISVIKCKEYEDAAYEKTWMSIGRHPPFLKKDLRCWSSDQPLVVGGENAKEKEFPHMALIGYQHKISGLTFNCGGSLISDQFILIAAHCILSTWTRLLGPPRVVRLGEHDRSTHDDNVVDIDVAQTILHPGYVIPKKYNDIGLIRMARSVKFNEYIRPACLPEMFSTGTQRAIATGWGKTNASESRGSDVLMKVVLDLYSDDECRQQYAPQSLSSEPLSDGIVAETQLCAGSRDEKKDVCQGDSGGPLQINHPYNKCIYVIAGVASFGKDCSRWIDKDTSGVYTRVYAFLDWIEDKVWQSNELTENSEASQPKE